jgi:hypothetical protein
MPTASPKLPTNQQLPGNPPPFQPANPELLASQAKAGDIAAYQASDADFRARYPQLYSSQQNFLNTLNTEMSGNVNPQLENTWTRAGLTNAVGATGNWSLGTGTTGMANVARNLGLSQIDYYNNILNQFNTANATFRPRTIGLSGSDLANVSLQNIAGQNNANQSAYAYKVQNNQYNASLAAQQAVANANAANAGTGNILGGISSIASLAIVALA